MRASLVAGHLARHQRQQLVVRPGDFETFYATRALPGGTRALQSRA
jgi:hypothetical protein